MATHASTLAWRIPRTEEPGATIHGVAESDTTELLHFTSHCSPPGSSAYGIFQARNTGMGCHFLLWGGSQPRDQTYISCSPALVGRFFTSAPPGKLLLTVYSVCTVFTLSCVRLFATPLIIQSMEFSRWVAFPFSRGSSQPRDRTQVSLIAGGFFYQLSHKGSPRILEWIAYPFFSRSS